VNVLPKENGPVKGRIYLVPVVVAFDDDGPFAAVPIPAAMPATVVVTELGAGTAKFFMSAELASIAVMIATGANANAKILSGSYGRCRDGDSCERCKCQTKLSHIQSSRSCPRENGGTESLFFNQSRGF
jgi:hypothetical protein